MGIFSRRRRGFSYYRRENRFRKFLTGLILFLVLLYLAFQFIALVVATPYRVHTASMQPTIPEGRRCLAVPLMYGIKIPFTEKFIPGFSAPHRGDVVVCEPPTYRHPPWYLRIADSVVEFFTLGRVRVALNSETPWDTDRAVKRVIGIPGDTLKMDQFTVYIRPEGREAFFSEFEIIQRSYDVTIDPLPEGWQPEFPFSGTMEEVTLGPGEYFLLGDNRTSSRDSTLWGPVERRTIASRIIISYLPGFKIH